MNKYNITIGSDPEVFVETLEGEVVSAVGMIPGTKDKPHPITDEGHYIQIDNVAMEFNIPPSKTEDEFVENITLVKSYLEDVAKNANLRLSTKASFSLKSKELKSPEAQVFGCEPDMNVYLKDINDPPNSEDKNLRCVGGHVHLGYPNPNFETTEKIVEAFDMFVTLPAMLECTDNRRRELYGKAGSFRVKDPWGLECRALSNYWIHSEESIRNVYKRSIAAVEAVLDGTYEQLKHLALSVRDAIDNRNMEEVPKLLKEIKAITNQKITK